jgi:hypothetical protein
LRKRVPPTVMGPPATAEDLLGDEARELRDDAVLLASMRAEAGAGDAVFEQSLPLREGPHGAKLPVAISQGAPECDFVVKTTRR